MNKIQTLLQKMRTEAHTPIRYFLSIGENELEVNSLLNKEISIHFVDYQCLNCGLHKDIYRQGFCKKCFFEMPQAGDWIIHPELSKAHLGIEDRNLEYEIAAQIQPHILYLANSSNVKVGVTRKSQMPTRWIDQGAHQAVIMLEVPNRYLAGIGEISLKKHISDKTNWRKMLTNQLEEIDLLQIKKDLKSYLPEEVLPYFSEENDIFSINYPVIQYPDKVNSLNLQKTPSYKGVLKGIKGQYLIFEDKIVFNIRSNEGFIVDICY
ncbi:MAG: DUF2797 domain-containing protein [Capnocytophaga sp.]|nr:DUF2797 domain-containing protein [Capnocytophaga sp.]